ncbi:MAG: IS3 family transposase [Nitrospirota bacterium]|nr:IS3 family transposase [Nitrospirota bacterium]
MGFFTRCGGVLCQGIETRFQCIARHRAAYPIRLMCRVLRVSASGYYAWRQRPDSRRSCENRKLLAEIRTSHAKSMGTYGILRIRAELRDRGFACGRNRVACLM